MASDLQLEFFLSFNYHFGGGDAYYSGTAGLGISKQISPHAQLGSNIAINFYNKGIGTLEDDASLNLDTVISGSATFGKGDGDPMTMYPLHIDSGSGLTDRYQYSLTLGTNFILNNHNRDQQVGFLQLRSDNFSFQTYNDFTQFHNIGIADGYDRWWTGGGNLTFGSKKSDYQLVIASDVFTADTDVVNRLDLTSGRELKAMSRDVYHDNLEFPENGSLKDRLFNYTPNIATEIDQDYFDNVRKDGSIWNADKDSFNLNQGRTSFKLRTPEGQFRLNGIGGSHMYSQDIIHRVINFHLIPSEREDYWEFNYDNLPDDF